MSGCKRAWWSSASGCWYLIGAKCFVCFEWGKDHVVSPLVRLPLRFTPISRVSHIGSMLLALDNSLGLRETSAGLYKRTLSHWTCLCVAKKITSEWPSKEIHMVNWDDLELCPATAHRVYYCVYATRYFSHSGNRFDRKSKSKRYYYIKILKLIML